ncbi:DUF3906 family protein [Paenibacillus ehimensis]|uniref:DUF3906 family protein n=1 Tax=Paenibacillus ehimensis TaxID=79264 RepID=UPI000472B973|nr:DUF3906 family protein [Paenibacillus ehimensis]
MYIYKLEVELQEQPFRVLVMAENEGQAFALPDELLARHFVRSPEMLDRAVNFIGSEGVVKR